MHALGQPLFLLSVNLSNLSLALSAPSSGLAPRLERCARVILLPNIKQRVSEGLIRACPFSFPKPYACAPLPHTQRNYRSFLLFVFTSTVLCLYVIGCGLAQIFVRHNELVDLVGLWVGQGASVGDIGMYVGGDEIDLLNLDASSCTPPLPPPHPAGQL